MCTLGVSALVACGESNPPDSSARFCSVAAELDQATEASVAAVFGQGFDGPVLTPVQVEEALDRQRELQGQLLAAAPGDAPDALDRYFGVRSDYMDAVRDADFEASNVKEDDARVATWSDEGTRALEEEAFGYIQTNCPS